MSELISGKMAFDYAYEGIEVLYRTIGFTGWASFNDVEWSVDDLRHGKFEFMLEKQTITINGNTMVKEDAFAFLCEHFDMSYDEVKKLYTNQ